MSEPSVVEQAIAIRMTCSNPEVAGRPVPLARVKVLSDGETSAAPAGAPVFRARGGEAPGTLAAELAAHIRQAGKLPAVVEAAGARFEVRPPEADGRRGRMAGVVAVVTGSAQGFGRGIAEELLKEGAYVVVSDLNEKLGSALAADMVRQCGHDAARFAPLDVTKQASTEACLASAVRAFGGLDMLVANAGVLKAGGLDEMDEASFDLVTAVNYKAFFVGAKAAAPLMKAQRRYNPHHLMDIVQINSKSGLEGSNRNFAYAGGKFGAIGLTQSFALELVPHGIKVNAICPGNYFDGPLWSDPEKGLFVQYLRAGKVPGAKTLEDVRRAYLSKVPMNRGCTPLDVARAIFYAREQEYETGQAIPVTGGQVMLR
jgi:NAD(P)-dependent dehydrogenase (short-subunit alcohol dehydrogenase family)